MGKREQLEEILARAHPRPRRGDGDAGAGARADRGGRAWRALSRTTRAISAGDVDVLNLTRPDDIERIHRAYLAAGADVLTTNTFTSTPVSQAEYGLEEARSGAQPGGAEIARACGRRRTALDSSPARSGRAMSRFAVAPRRRPELSRGDVRPASRRVRRGDSWPARGGADLLLIETVFDTLNGKAAIAAVKDVLEERGRRPARRQRRRSSTRSGRTLSGQTIDAFWIASRARGPVRRLR